MAGQIDKAKGRVKEAAGDLSGDKDLQSEGKADRAAVRSRRRSGRPRTRSKVSSTRRRTG